MTISVADRVEHRLPRPIKCDCCGSPRVHLQKRRFLGLRVTSKWDLIWHCLDCLALVGCHEGTDIPFGLMGDLATRTARYEAHGVFDRLWRGGGFSRAEAYLWMAKTLGIPHENAHIGMLSHAQCLALINAVEDLKRAQKTRRHWKQETRKRRRN